MYLKRNIERILEKDIKVSDEMTKTIKLWSDCYKDRAPWVSGDVKSLNLCSAVAGEFARQVTLELKSVISGSERGNFLNETYKKVIDSIRRYTEYACALGGVVLKPYLDDGKIEVEYIGAENFYPTAFDGKGNVISAAFCEHKKMGDKLFIRIEHHEMKKSGIEITNRAFRCPVMFSFGNEVPLSSVKEWEDIEPFVFLPDVKKPLFSYFKVPFANNVDMHSPLGVSVFSRALNVICETDKQYSRLLWEFEGGELAIDANIDAVKNIGKDFMMPSLKERLFRGLDIESGNGDLYSVFAPELRDKSFINGLDQLLVRVEDLCGLARGVFSNATGNIRTATELKLLRQRTYSSVTDIQKSLKTALCDLVDAMDALCDVYSLAPSGKFVMTFDFDDSTITDRQTEFAERQALVDQGILNKWELRMWYLGETEEQAKERIEILEKNNQGQKEKKIIDEIEGI